MGGNALKNCTTRRYDADEYFELVSEVGYKLCTLFHDAPISDIKAYRNKETFGDADFVIASDSLPSNWVAQVINTFGPKESVKNGNVLSFEYKEFQIDLITTPFNEYKTSLKYFAYNDLGNLLGRIAHSMGLKLGHDGLSYNWRIETYQFKNEIISTNWEEICNVLGVSYARYCEGFDTLEDIFKFVVASRFFHSDIYLLENRNNYARTRDKKRKTYTEFLTWIEDYEHTEDQVHRKLLRDSFGKDQWLGYFFENIKGFQATYYRVQAEWTAESEYKARFNGDLVREWTGLDKQELGKFMKYLREKGALPKSFVIENPHLVKTVVNDYCTTWKEDNGN